MEIDQFHISGFGHFREMGSPQFSSGMQVLYGDNEAGKSTLMAFFSSMFYGLRSAEYPPLFGGIHGGKIVFRDEQGTQYILQRHATVKRKTGNFIFADENGADCQAVWQETLGKVDKTVFESIFWLTHRELERLSMGQGQLAGYLYSASLGTKGIGYLESIRSLEETREQLFKKQGTKPQINQLLRQMDKLAEQQQAVISNQEDYWQLAEQRQGLLEEEQQVVDMEEQLLKQKALYSKMERAWDQWERISYERERLKTLFTSDQWNCWNGNLEEIEYLISQTTQYFQYRSQMEQWLNDMRLLEEKIQVANDRVGAACSDEQLQEKRTSGQTDGEFLKQQVRSIQREITDLERQEGEWRRAVGEAEIRYRALQPDVAAEAKFDKGAFGNVFWQPILWSLLMVILYSVSGSSSGIAGFFGQPYGVVAALTTVGVWGYAVFHWKSVKKQNNRRANKEAQALTYEIQQMHEQIGDIDRTRRNKQDHWEQVLALLTEWERTQEQVSQYRHLEAKVHPLSSFVRSYEEQVITILVDLFEKADSNRGYVDRVESWEQIAVANGTHQSLENAVHRLVDLYEMIQASHQLIEQAQQKLRLLAYPEHTTEELFAALAETNVILIEEHLYRIKGETEKCNVRRKQIQEQIGSISHQLDQLAADERLADINLQIAQYDQQLYEATKQWSVATIAKWALEKAKFTFEIEHQPEVLREANGLLASLTEGNYQRIVMPVGETIINVQHRSGNWITAEHLSQGTKEQLFLALRLGFLLELKKHGIKCPIFIDDILVNFDIRRARAAIRTIIEWSREFQIFFFTCHKHIVREFIDLGVEAIYHVQDQTILCGGKIYDGVRANR